MPDISKLVEISKIYDVTIDEILDNERQSKAVEHLYKNGRSSHLLEVISIMKPKEISEAVKNSKINVENFQNLFNCRSYLSMEDLSMLAMQNCGLIKNFSEICEIASLVTQEALEFIALAHSDKVESFEQICEIASRMSKPCISKLVSEHLDLANSF